MKQCDIDYFYSLSDQIKTIYRPLYVALHKTQINQRKEGRIECEIGKFSAFSHTDGSIQC